MNNLYGWAVSQNLPLYGFNWVEIILNLKKISWKRTMEIVIKDIFLRLMFNILKNDLLNDLPFLPEGKKILKIEKLLANLHDKKEYFIHMGNLKQALNHGLVLKK